MASRAFLCNGCGDVSRNRTCTACQRRYHRRRDATRGSTAARGYGAEHRADKQRKLPQAIGTPCPLCGQTMTQQHADRGQLNRHHEIPVAHGGKHTSDGVIVHRWCDARAGATTRRR